MRRANRILLIAGMCAMGVTALHASIFRHKASDAEPAPAAVMSLGAIDVDASRVQLHTSANPAYTSYSPSPEVFVVDLTGTSKAESLVIPLTLPPGVASISADEVTEMGNRLTRVTFHLSAPAALKASAEGSVVTVTIPSILSGNSAGEPATTTAAIPIEAEAKPVDTPRAEPLPDSARTTVSEPLAVAEPLALPKAKNLKRIETTGAGAAVSVHLEGDGEIEYKAFRLTNPARVVLDLSGIQNTVPRTTIPAAESLVKRIRVSQFATSPVPVTRVVVDLATGSDFQVVRDGAGLRVTFGAEVVAANRVTAPEPPPAVSTRQAQVETPVVVNPPAAPERVAATTPVVPVPPKQAPVAADLPSQVPAIAENAPAWKMPETESAGARAVINAPQDQPQVPVPAPASRPSPSKTPMGVAAPAGENVFNESSADTQPSASGGTSQVLSGKLSSAAGGRTLSGGERVYTGEPISLNLKDADIKDVLRTFAQLTGLNVAVDPEVTGKVTVDFVDVPWDQALDIILRQNKLTWVLEGNVMRVGQLSVISAETDANRKMVENERLNVELQTVGFKLSYAKAADVQALLSQIKSDRARIIVDARTNQLIISEIPQYLQTMRNLIDSIDVPTRQVVIEARIVETTKTFTQAWGFDWSFNGALDPALGNGTGLIFPNRVGYTGGPFTFDGGATPLLALSLSDVLGSFNLDIALNAAESESLAKVIGAPKVTTQDNHSATISSGVQIPYQTRVNFTTTISYVDAVLSLTVTPQITEAGTVIMDIAVNKTSPTSPIAGAAGVSLNTRQATTKLMVRDGATAVIGGIYQVTDTRAQNRIPILYEIPVIGNLFKDHQVNISHDELLIFITPRIVRN